MKHLFTTLVALCCIASTQAQWNTTGNAATSTNFLGTTNSVPLRIRTNNVQRMIVDSLGRVGVGIAFPTQLFTVQSSGSVPAASWITSGAPVFAGYGENTPGNADFNLLMASASAANARGVFGMKRSRGTLAAPGAVLNNDQLGSLLVSGYDGSNFQGAAAVDFFADGTPSAGNVPVRISFVTGTNSGTRTERLRIGNSGDITMNTTQFFLQRSSGNIGIGNAAPTTRLDVTGNIKSSGTMDAAGGFFSNGQRALLATNSNTFVGLSPASNTSTFNTAVGYNALGGSNSGTSNTAMGGQALLSNAAGSQNAGYGFGALQNNTTGNQNTAIGGRNAGLANVSGSNNTFIGSDANASTGNLTNATAIGAGAIVGRSNSLILGDTTVTVGIGTSTPNTGFKLDIKGNALINGVIIGRDRQGLNANISVGSEFQFNTTGQANTIVGSNALFKNTSGSNNVALGVDAISKNTTGTDNSSVGAASMYNNSTGNENAVLGVNALQGNTSGNRNTAVGRNAGINNVDGSSNTFLGTDANATAGSLTNASAIGAGAIVGQSNSMVLGNNSVTVGIGTSTPNIGFKLDVRGNALINGVIIGKDANALSGNITMGTPLQFNISGTDNTVLGANALFANTTGSQNTSLGVNSGSRNTTGNGNVAIGNVAMFKNTTGNNNTALGNAALQNAGIGSNNTLLGALADVLDSSISNATAVGANAKVQTSNSLVLGGSGADAVKVGIGIASPTDNLHIFGTGSQGVMLESPSGNSNTSLYKSRTYFGTALNTYAAFGGTDDGDFSLRASIYVPNAADNGVMEAVSVIKASGNMGIGTTAPTAKLSVNGNANNTTGAWSVFSDSRVKKVNGDFTDGLNVIKQIRTIKFNYNQNAPFNAAGEQIGVVAQELEKVAPYMVSKKAMGEMKDLREVNNQAYPFLLINAVKELAAQNEELKKQMETKDAALTELKNEVAAIKAMLQGGNAKSVATVTEQNVNFGSIILGQNVPNPPVNNFTRISYEIPVGASKAQMVITDEMGRTIKQIPLVTFGKGQLNVDTKALTPGTYSYTLLIDGKLIDTKQLVIAR